MKEKYPRAVTKTSGSIKWLAIPPQNIRNVALVGHAASGKTTLAERILLTAGVIDSMGDVTKGTTVADFDPLEKTHGRSLNSAVMHIDHAGKHINFIDTPGYPDFNGHALGVLPAVETAAVVVDARSGVQMITTRMMETAKSRGLARLIVINKMDADDIDLEAVLASIVETFGSECLPINLPAAGGSKVVDCFFNPSDETPDFFRCRRSPHTHCRSGSRDGRGIDGSLPRTG